jgi:hypothetical protein
MRKPYRSTWAVEKRAGAVAERERGVDVGSEGRTRKSHHFLIVITGASLTLPPRSSSLLYRRNSKFRVYLPFLLRPKALLLPKLWMLYRFSFKRVVYR